MSDNLGNHHLPQKAPAKSIVAGYPQDKMAMNAPAIRLPNIEHDAITKLQSKRDTTRLNARQLLADDLSMLKSKTNAPLSSRRKLLELSRESYGEALKKERK